MPWKYNGGTLKEGREFTGTDGTQYPKVWMRYSDSEKAAIGITWENPPASEASYDKKFYSGRQSGGTLIPKSLTDVNEVDGSGNPIRDAAGNQIVTLGLKSVWISKIKRIAKDKLAVHDWYITRKAEKSTAIPSSVSTYRDNVRTKCAAIETSINNAANLTAFMALWTVPTDSDGKATGNAPINDWPEEI